MGEDAAPRAPYAGVGWGRPRVPFHLPQLLTTDHLLTRSRMSRLHHWHPRPRSGSLTSEMKLAVPWGHIAAKLWGSQQGPPVLCLHGWLDNANSFDRLIPLLPKDFHYVAMDFGGHGLSSHYSPGLPYYQQNFVIEVQRVVAALKWNRFSIMGHSFGGIVGGMYSCTFPEMVDKLILLDTLPCALDYKESENLLTYKRRMIEHMLQIEASQKPQRVLSPEEMLQGFLKNNSHVGEECARLLLQRGTTQVATGLVLSRDRRISLPEHSIDFVSRNLLVHFIRKLQAHVLLIKATQGFYNVRRENDADKEALHLVKDILKSVLKEWFQYTEVPGNHYVHMNQPQRVAGIISSFLKSSAPNQL
ncbi:serine hydrolase-like protein 2 isoform X2 [Prionailurus bengalensis]|uniref:serine hydrolase-like protein 2 isoform X2 n=1 Tax=Prionailurus bengalensis TaxID=37029 RepID=UPI001CA88A94|nr:serine hydrolase-like protein 2 isoform X2 [Prionailurus bengalensis]